MGEVFDGTMYRNAAPARGLKMQVQRAGHHVPALLELFLDDVAISRLG